MDTHTRFSTSNNNNNNNNNNNKYIEITTQFLER